MISRTKLLIKSTGAILAYVIVLCGASWAQEAPIIQPGIPGEEGRQLSAAEAVEIADTRYSEDDVEFMQGMILHHFQAVQMAALVSERTSRSEVVDLASRIDVTQADEIEFMRSWLTSRGENAPDPVNDPHVMHNAGHHNMSGMASPEQMAELAAASGTDFDALFLELMIAHHEGAVDMVDHLLAQRGSAYDIVLLDFVNDVRAEQEAEIRRMNAILSGLSQDPRTGLKPGFRDAGVAISNLVHVANVPKPTGFYDAENPAGLPFVLDDEEDDEPRVGDRDAYLRFSNTDMAFLDDLMAVGNYHGFNLYRLEDAAPKLISSVVCPGGQNDVSIVGDLLIVSVEDTRARRDCGRQGVDAEVSEDRFMGLRLFDVSDPVMPVQVGQVQTCRGSHTHSVVSSDDETIVVYNSGTKDVRPEEELAGCVSGLPGDENTALFSIDVIEIPVANPSAARIIDSPRVFADDDTGRTAGLWAGGDHGEGTQSSSRTDQCHDITVFPSLNLAAGACSGNGIIMDISDPRAPRRIDAVVDQGFAYWHSATFNNDGTKVLFTDEWGGGGRPRCRAQDPSTWGADAFYEINDGRLEFTGYFKIPSAQTESENCVAHNGSIIPVPGRDIFVQSWYQGGISVIDFTDGSSPIEIAFFDRGPVHEEHLVSGGFWSSYWYNGRIYGTEIARGIDVFELAPSEFLTENEIAAARLADQGQTFNPQQQFPVSWPTHPVIGLAYVDQLVRDDAISADLAKELSDVLGRGAGPVEAVTSEGDLSGELGSLADRIPDGGDDSVTAERLTALRGVINGLAESLR